MVSVLDSGGVPLSVTLIIRFIVGEVAEEFGGEDPALPDTRDLIDGTARRLAEAREEAERYTGPVAWGEPDAALVDKVRALVEEP